MSLPNQNSSAMRAKRTGVRSELLEQRRLLAAPPPTIAGLSVTVDIVSGTEPFADDGGFIVAFNSTGRGYSLFGDPGIEDTNGTYRYSVTAADTAQVTANDVLLGSVRSELTFITLTSGRISVTRSEGGSQLGVFSMTGAAFTEVNQGVVRVGGTVYSDAFSMSVSGGRINITRNNVTEKVSLSGISRVELYSGDGDDTIQGGNVTVPIYADAGAGNALIFGGAANDTITGGGGKNRLFGGDGDDRLNGSGGRDFLAGEAGNDRLYGRAGDDTLDGGGGVDRLFGGDGADLLLGGGSNDKLYGEAGYDVLNGQGQADLIDGGDGSDAASNDPLDILESVETVL